MKLTDRELRNALDLSRKEPQWYLSKLLEAVGWGLFLGITAWTVWATLWWACGPYACPGTGY